MPITLLQAQTALSNRCGELLTKVGLNPDPTANPSPVYGDPLASSLRDCGYTSANPIQPTDADLAPVTDGYINKLLDIAELRLLYAIAENAAEAGVKVRLKMHEVDPEFFLRSIQESIDRRQKYIVQRYYTGGQRVYSGTINPVAFRGFLIEPRQWGISTIKP